jgi:RNA polymerase sigma factor (sigma-70 family)
MLASSSPDSALVRRARLGSHAAFAQIVRRYESPLRAYCARLLGPSAAQDAVQQAFLQAFVALRDPHDEREVPLRPWLYRIAYNCAVDILRRRDRDHEQLDPEMNGVPQPQQVVERRETLRRLIGAMRALPEGQRRALVARELEGRSYQEISAELGASEGGVRQLIFRARSALRTEVALG